MNFAQVCELVLGYGVVVVVVVYHQLVVLSFSSSLGKSILLVSGQCWSMHGCRLGLG